MLFLCVPVLVLIYLLQHNTKLLLLRICINVLVTLFSKRQESTLFTFRFNVGDVYWLKIQRRSYAVVYGQGAEDVCLQ